MICRISTPLASGTQGTGLPPTVQDAVSGTSPDEPSACQLTRARADQHQAAQLRAEAAADRGEQSLGAAGDRHRRQPGGSTASCSASRVSAAANRSSGTSADARLAASASRDPGLGQGGETVRRQHRRVRQLRFEAALGSAEAGHRGPTAAGGSPAGSTSMPGSPPIDVGSCRSPAAPAAAQHGPPAGDRATGGAAVGGADGAEAAGLAPSAATVRPAARTSPGSASSSKRIAQTGALPSAVDQSGSWPSTLCGSRRRQVEHAVVRHGELGPGPPAPAVTGLSRRCSTSTAGPGPATDDRHPERLVEPAVRGGVDGQPADVGRAAPAAARPRRWRRRDALVDARRTLVEPGRERRRRSRRRRPARCTGPPSNRRWTAGRPCPGWWRRRRRSAGSSPTRTSPPNATTHIQVIAG